MRSRIMRGTAVVAWAALLAAGCGGDDGDGDGASGSDADGGDDTVGAPIGDHWHAAFGVNVCGEWLPDPEAFGERAGTGEQSGVHSHGDGLVHIHPRAEDEAGPNASIGTFLEHGGWRASADDFEVWDGEPHATGDTCDGTPARVRWAVNGEGRTGDISEYVPSDGDVVVLALLPDGEPIGEPPSVEASDA